MHELFAQIQSLYLIYGPWVFGSVYAVWILFSGSILLLQRRAPVATLAWLLAFAFLPVLSFFVYIIFGPRRLRRKRFKRAYAKKLTQALTAEALANNAALQQELATLSGIANLVFRNSPSLPMRAEYVELFDSGAEAYRAIEEAILQAQHHIHLEYFIWQPDELGTRWRDLLIQRAMAGVKIRVLIDAIGSKACKRQFWQPLKAAGGEVAFFNPISFAQFRSGLLNFRSHRKIVVIDGKVGFTGGINVASEHTHVLSKSNAWRDTHLCIRGLPVLNLQRVFFEDWQYSAKIKLFKLAPEYFPAASLSRTGPWVQIIDSGPDEAIPALHRYIFSAITQAQRRVWLTTPYFIPDDALYTAMVCAQARGVDVRLIVPAQGDFWLSNIATRSFAEDVAREGVNTYLYMDRMIHAKTIVVDDELAIVGSANLDNRSFRLNFEVAAAIYDEKITNELAQFFEADLRKCKIFVPDELKEPLHMRLLSSMARLFAPIL